MIPFPHLWLTDRATGELRCFRRKANTDSPVLAGALAHRMRLAVQHVAVSDVMLGAARSLLAGYGEVSGGGAAELLERAARKGAAHLKAMTVIEAELAAIVDAWPDGAPADYAAAKAASRQRLRERFPNADAALLDD